MMEDRRTWWQQWTDTNIKSLNVMVGGPCLGPPKLGMPAWGGTQEHRTGSPGAVAALMGPVLTLTEGRSRALQPAGRASTGQPQRHH